MDLHSAHLVLKRIGEMFERKREFLKLQVLHVHLEPLATTITLTILELALYIGIGVVSLCFLYGYTHPSKSKNKANNYYQQQEQQQRGLLQQLFSFGLSPQRIFAKSLAESLDSFLVIDQTTTEANFFRNAGVTLHNVLLKPITTNLHISEQQQIYLQISGSIHSMALQWNWGIGSSSNNEEKGAGSSLLHSPKLKCSNVRITIILSDHQECNNLDGHDKTTTANPTTTSPEEEATSEEKEDDRVLQEKKKTIIQAYIDDQISRIIDDLAVEFTEFRIHVKIMPSEDIMLFGGTALTLETVGGGRSRLPTSEQELKQVLTMTNISSNVLLCHHENSDNDIHHPKTRKQDHRHYPLLDSFSYQATCIQTGGERFGTTMMRNLRITGISMGAGICLHAGEPQVCFLKDLVERLLLRPTTSSSQTPPHPIRKIGAASSTTAKNNKFDLRSSLRRSHANRPPVDKRMSAFRLPLSGLSLVFSNETKVTIQDLLVEYKMDGSWLCITGHNDLMVNEVSVLALPNFSSRWQLNLSKTIRTFRLFDTNDGAVVATIQLRHKDLNPVLQAVQQLQSVLLQDNAPAATPAIGRGLSLQSIIDESAATKTTQHYTTTNASPVPWEFQLEGGLRVILEGQEEEGAAGDGEAVKVDCLLRDLLMKDESMTFNIDKLHIPGIFRLKDPIHNISLLCQGSQFDLMIRQVVLILEKPRSSMSREEAASESSAMKDTDTTSKALDSDSTFSLGDSTKSTSQPPFVLTFGGVASIGSIAIYETKEKRKELATIDQVVFAFGPDASTSINTKSEEEVPVPTGGFRAALTVGRLNHEMLVLGDASVSAVIWPNDLGAIHSFECNAKSVQVTSGYSVFDWERHFDIRDSLETIMTKSKEKKKARRKPLRLPFARVQKLNIKVIFNGDVVGTDGSVLHFSKFKGKETTTIDHLINYYAVGVISNVPGMVTDADVLGMNVTDGAATWASAVFGTGYMAALGLGSAAMPAAAALGIVALDGAKHMVNAGKRHRGKEAEDRYHVGDFIRGIGYSAVETTRSGARRRGKRPEQSGSPIDWAVGAFDEITEYTDNNKARVGAAGMAVVGFSVGWVILGPIGGIAGVFVAHKTTTSFINAIDELVKDEYDADKVDDTSLFPDVF